MVDGTGAAASKADVAIRGDQIVAVGSFEIDDKAKVIDVSSLIVAPGFIDLHTHSDPGITEPAKRLNRNYLTQGVTTIVTGNCGLGVVDIAKYFAGDRRARRRHQRHPPDPARGGPIDASWATPTGAPSADELDADEAARRARDGGRRMGDLERLDLRSRPLRQDARADRARQGRGPPRRHLRLAHPQRRRSPGRIDRRGDRDRQGSRNPRAHLAPEGQRQALLGHGRQGAFDGSPRRARPASS